jgi:pimeloyl-ACP methyl ester carboxylesterase
MQIYESPDTPSLSDDEAIDEPLHIHRRGPERRCHALVIFVHGLNGDRYGTWGHFPSLVYEDFPEVDLGFYGYRNGWKRIASLRSIPLEDEARVMADELRQLEYEQIVLIGHSLGGVLCKAAIHDLFQANLETTLRRLRGLMLIAAPQTGPRWGFSWLSALSHDIEALKPAGRLLAQIADCFKDRTTPKKPPPEDRRLWLPVYAVEAAEDLWVGHLSAGLDIDREHRHRARGSHTEIVKPADRDVSTYVFVADALAKCLELRDGDPSVPDPGRTDPKPSAQKTYRRARENRAGGDSIEIHAHDHAQAVGKIEIDTIVVGRDPSRRSR